MTFKEGDKIEVARVETSPGQFLGKSGMHGEVTGVGAPMEVLTGQNPSKRERHYFLKLWWPLSPEKTESDSMPESWLVSRSE